MYCIAQSLISYYSKFALDWARTVSSASASTTLPCLTNTYCTVFHCTWALPNCIDLLLLTISFLLLPLL